MTGLCGWIGGAIAAGPGGDVIAAMAQALDPGSPAARRISSQVADGGAVAVAHGVEAGGLDRQDGVIAAVVGTPDWFETVDAARAARDGVAQALIAAYARVGDAIPTIVDGVSFAVLDMPRRRALVAVDRMGKQPMCYAVAPDGGLVFGSTATSVRRYPGLPQEIDHQALYDMVVFSRVSAPLAIFRGQSKMVQAECLIHEDGHLRPPSCYWRIPYDQPQGCDIEALGEELVRLTEDAVARAIADVPPERVAAFLSGGLDSSTVLGMLSRRIDGLAQGFTIGFAVDGFDEMEYARKAARHFGATLNEHYLAPADVADLVPKIVAAYDEPYANSSAVPAYVCALAARGKGIDLMLAGDGGDELFAGNRRYALQKLLGCYQWIPEWLRHGVVEPVVNGFPFGDHIMPVRRARGYIRRANAPMPDRMESFNPVLWRDPGEIFAPDIAAAIDPTHPTAHLRAVYESTGSESMLHRMLRLDHQATLADDDLRKVGRTCEMAGVRVRYPLLDRRIVELSARVPPAALLKGFRLRHFYKHAFQRFLPASTLTKSKHGFGSPVGHWLREYRPLQALVADALADLRRRRMFNDRFVDEVVTGHREIHATYYGEQIWSLLVISLWLQAQRL